MPFHTPVTKRQSRRTVLGASVATIGATLLGGSAVDVAARAAAPPAQADEAAFPAEIELALEKIVDEALAAGDIPGALVGVWVPGQGAWQKAAGIGDLATAAPVTLDDHVRIASNTKTFVGVVILQLVDEGLIGLDDALESYLPGIANGNEITIRQVLGMSAGIYDFINDPLVAVDYAADPLLPFTPEEALAIIRGGQPDFAPGERVQYSNSNYILLGLIAEQVTGQPLVTLIEERIIQPLGLAQTSFPDTPEMPEPYMHGYTANATGDPLVDASRSNPDLPWASGAMVSTLGDLRTWVEALASGALISPESAAAQREFGPIPAPPGNDLGYGLGLLSFNGFLGHNGGIVGYSSWMLHEPESGATLVIVTNRSSIEGGTADLIFGGIVRLLFTEQFPIPTPEASPAATPVA